MTKRKTFFAVLLAPFFFFFFFLQIRKHLRTRRLTGVKQLGSDRIVDFEFGAEDVSNTYHIIAEFYAAVRETMTQQPCGTSCGFFSLPFLPATTN